MKIVQINNSSFSGVKLKCQVLKKAVKTNTAASKQLKVIDKKLKTRKTLQEIAEWQTAQRTFIEDLGSLWD